MPRSLCVLSTLWLTLLVVPRAVAETIFEASFEGGADGFVYQDDAFLQTKMPDYAAGSVLVEESESTGVLEVVLGNRDSKTVLGMSGGWSREFAIDEPMRAVRIFFRYRLTQEWGYEPDEFSQLMVTLDGKPIPGGEVDHVARINGDGDSGPAQTTGWLSFSHTERQLAAGPHTLVIGGYNNKKTAKDESTRILIDDVRVTGVRETR